MARKNDTPGAPVSQKKELVPDSIPRLLLVLGKGALQTIPKQGLWILLKSAAIFLFIMWLNFYVVAVRNAGYGSGPVLDTQQKPWIWLFNVGANKAAFSMLSFLVPYLITSLWHQIRSLGVKPFFRNLFQFFHWTGYCVSESGRRGFSALLFATAIVMPLGLFAQNAGLFITIAVGQFFGYISQNRNLTYLFSRAGWLDFQRLFQRKKPLRDLNPGIGGFLSLGLLLGAVVLLLIPMTAMKVLSIILFIVFAALGVLLLRTAIAPKAVAMMLAFLGVNLIWFRLFGRAFADDAGFDELGNNLGNYVRDPGGQLVIKNGVQPGILGTLGSLIGSLAGTAVEAGAYVGGKVVDGVKYVGGKAVDGAKYVGGKVVDGAKYVGGKVVDGVGYVAEKTSDAINATIGEGIKQIVGPEVWDGMWENIEKEVTEAEGQIASGWEKAKEVAEKAYENAKKDISDFVEDVWNNPGVYIETVINGTIGTIKETAELGWEVLTNPQIIVDTVTGTTSDLVTGAQKIGGAVVNGIYTTITDPKKAWEFVKDFVGYDNFKNAFDPNRGLIDRISQYGLGVIKLAGAISTGGAVVKAGGKIAQTGVTQTIKNLGDDILKGLKGKGTGTAPAVPKFTTAGIADTSHMNPTQLKNFQKLVKEFGFDEATIRMGGNKAIAQKIASGEVLAKPHAIMNKTMNALDELLGGPKNSQGLAAHFKPTLPSTADMQKMKPADLEKLWNRYLQRYTEFNKEGARIQNLVNTGKAKLTNDGLITSMGGKPYGSDWDLGHLIKNGQQASSAETKAFVEACKKAGIPVEHGSVGDWVNMSDFQKEAYGSMIRKMMNVKGGEGVISVGQSGPAMKKFLDEFIKAVPAR